MSDKAGPVRYMSDKESIHYLQDMTDMGVKHVNTLWGTWRLIEIADLQPEGPQSRVYKVEGRLTYVQPNNVFVGLAYYKPEGYSSNFYSGVFDFDDVTSQIYHKVIVSSDENRNGKTLKRHVEFLNNQLILTGKNNLGHTVRLVWEKE